MKTCNYSLILLLLLYAENTIQGNFMQTKQLLGNVQWHQTFRRVIMRVHAQHTPFLQPCKTSNTLNNAALLQVLSAHSSPIQGNAACKCYTTPYNWYDIILRLDHDSMFTRAGEKKNHNIKTETHSNITWWCGCASSNLYYDYVSLREAWRFVRGLCQYIT